MKEKRHCSLLNCKITHSSGQAEDTWKHVETMVLRAFIADGRNESNSPRNKCTNAIVIFFADEKFSEFKVMGKR